MAKRSYEVVTPLRNGGPKPIPPGGTVELDEKEGDALVRIGALKAGARVKAEKQDPPAKPLEEQSFDELKATAKAEKVPGFGLIKDEAKLRAAIVAHRAKKEG
ncbi:MAG TPA: hypothetical protein VF605_11730 [Allosphingosinicella sp.]|jgi:hypothetical protein